MSFQNTVTTGSTGSPGLRQRSASERLSAKRVREARDKLSLRTGGKPEFQYDLLFMFARNELGASLAIPLLAIVVALAASIWTPAIKVSIWIATIFVTKGILLHYCRQFLKTPRSEFKPREWRRKLSLAAVLYGISWGLLALIPPANSDQTIYILIFSTFIFVIAMSMMFASSVLPILYCGTIPITACLIFRFAMFNDPFYWALAGTAALIHVYFFFLIGGLNRTVLTMLSYRVEKDALIAEIEQAKSISDEARRNAEEANIAKSRFLATVSHELRTPLNAIIGFSEIMKNELIGKHDNPTYKEYASDIHDSGKHLLDLINEILDLSRIEAGKYELHEEPVALIDIVDDCCRLMKLRIEEKALILELDIAPDLPLIWGDERAIRQICLNLLSNAVKFTPSAGKISISAGKTADGGQFMSISDNGPGIAEEEIPKVLSSFGQGSLAYETAEGGTGLGLPIVNGLMRLHDGTLQIKSALRKGTTAITVFPDSRIVNEMQANTLEQEDPSTSNEEKVHPVAAGPAKAESTDSSNQPSNREQIIDTLILKQAASLEIPEKHFSQYKNPGFTLTPMIGRKNELKHLKSLAFAENSRLVSNSHKKGVNLNFETGD